MGFDPVSCLIGKAAGGGGGSTIVPKTITENGTYNASSDNADGYSPVMVNIGDVTLPDAYQKVQYLSVTGTQYVNVPTSFESTDILDFYFKVEATSGTGERGFAGFQGSVSYTMELYFDDRGLYWYRQGSSHSLYPNAQNNVIYAGGFKTTYTSQSLNVGLFRTDTYLFYGNIYEFRITKYFETAWVSTPQETKTSELLLHLIPCYRKSDNEPGFYDVANDVFYANVGTGEFGIGPVV